LRTCHHCTTTRDPFPDIGHQTPDTGQFHLIALAFPQNARSALDTIYTPS
jgi:hypothetical protein